MKPHYLLTLLASIGGIILMSATVLASDINVRINHIDTTKPGKIMVMLFSKDGFPKKHEMAISTHQLPPISESLTVAFSEVPPEFAIKVLHDEDETGQVTKNWTGILPAEGLGFSNGAKLNFGPPSFSRAKVKAIDVTESLIINVIYP